MICEQKQIFVASALLVPQYNFLCPLPGIPSCDGRQAMFLILKHRKESIDADKLRTLATSVAFILAAFVLLLIVVFLIYSDVHLAH
jgi:hypothetical protein